MRTSVLTLFALSSLACYAGLEEVATTGMSSETGDTQVSTGDGDGDPTTTTTGDGDGDPTTTTTTTTSGDGDGDPTTTTTGDGDGDPTTTGDGDGDPTTTTTGDGDGDPLPEGCTAEGVEIVELINEYRMQNGKATIPLSPSLCIVGQTHVIDLAENNPNQGQCNLHSWSDQGPWVECCYTPDHANAACMWSKPSELTVYPGNGYENAAGGGGGISPGQAVDLWKNSPGHNAVMLNEGSWANFPWGAVGAGLYQGYAVVWFGQEADPAG